jgi:hypothetical protein
VNPALAASVPRLPASVEHDLARVEERLGVELASRESRMQAIARHLVQAGSASGRPSSSSSSMPPRATDHTRGATPSRRPSRSS